MPNRYGTTPTGPGEYREADIGLARPKDAATLIVVRGGTEPTILMGKRAATHRFMPNKFVFPGGRLDLIDQRLQVPGNLNAAGDGATAQGHAERGHRPKTPRVGAGCYQGNL